MKNVDKKYARKIFIENMNTCAKKYLLFYLLKEQLKNYNLFFYFFFFFK